MYFDSRRVTILVMEMVDKKVEHRTDIAGPGCVGVLLTRGGAVPIGVLPHPRQQNRQIKLKENKAQSNFSIASAAGACRGGPGKTILMWFTYACVGVRVLCTKRNATVKSAQRGRMSTEEHSASVSDFILKLIFTHTFASSLRTFAREYWNTSTLLMANAKCKQHERRKGLSMLLNWLDETLEPKNDWSISGCMSTRRAVRGRAREPLNSQ